MKGSRYLGTIPAQKLLDTLTEIKVELARITIHGTSEDFIGHVGGDDFVLVTHPNVVDQLCQEIISYKRSLKLV
jgi:hypothetical protein